MVRGLFLGMSATLALTGIVWGSWGLSLRALDQPFQLPPPDPLRADTGGLAILGTSLSTQQHWPETLRTQLESCLGTPLPLHVFAQGGAPSSTAARYLPDLIGARPRIVLIEYSINDADLRREMSVAQSRETHAAALEQLRSALPEARIFLVRLNRAHGLRAVLRPRLGTYEALYPTLAETYGTGLLDSRMAWKDARATTPREVLQPDGLHPTVAAADQVNAPALAAQLITQLDLVCPPPGGGDIKARVRAPELRPDDARQR